MTQYKQIEEEKMEQTYIKVDNLTKDYGNAKGVFNVSF